MPAAIANIMCPSVQSILAESIWQQKRDMRALLPPRFKYASTVTSSWPLVCRTRRPTYIAYMVDDDRDHCGKWTSVHIVWRHQQTSVECCRYHCPSRITNISLQTGIALNRRHIDDNRLSTRVIGAGCGRGVEFIMWL